MKKRYILLILLVLLGIGALIQFAMAKYYSQEEINLEIVSAKMYFEDNATDITLPYSHNTANMDIAVHNYIDNDYTIQDIDYKIKITNNNYTFSVNGESATGDTITLLLEGGERNSANLHIAFTRLDTTNVPVTEDIQVEIATNGPYTYSKTFTVTITNGAIEVTGNPTKWTNQDAILEIVPSTPGTTLTEYSFDGGTTWQSTSTKTYTENTKGIEAYAKDSNGAILGPVKANITKIDKIPPHFAFVKNTEYNADGTSKKVDALIATLGEDTSVFKRMHALDSESGITDDTPKCYRGDTEITLTSYFDQVGRYRVTYKAWDEAGNDASTEAEILIRWPLAGKYVVARQNVLATGQSSTAIGSGLYKDDASTGLDSSLPYSSKYYYSGTNVNNYISFADTTFNIVNVAVNDTVKLIGPMSSKEWAWGDRKIYESQVYSNWSEKWWPRGQLYNSDDDHYILLTAQQKAHMAEATFYAGRFTDGETPTLADIINYERTSARELGGDSAAFQGYSAFPNVSDYLKSCNEMSKVYNISSSQTNEKIFKQNSWLAIYDELWTINSKRATATDNDFWTFSCNLTGFSHTDNRIRSRTYYYNQNYQPVFYLKNDTILSGTGTSADPFTVQEHWGWFDPYQELQ